MLLADKARASGVEVELTVGEGMFHVYPMFLDAFPGGGRGVRRHVRAHQ